MTTFRRFKTADGFIDYDTTKGMFTTWCGDLAHKARAAFNALDRKYNRLSQEQKTALFLEALEEKASADGVLVEQAVTA